MNATEWERVKEIFESALGVPEQDRAGHVWAVCAGQPALREMVLDLLRNHTTMSLTAAAGVAWRAPVLIAGELIAGRFRIVRFIASGGMGEVYEANDEWLSLRLALKTVKPELVSQSDALERFKRELLVARRVSHENLCRVFDFVEHRHRAAGSDAEILTPCFTMELLEGESLAEMLRRRRPLSCDEALPLIRQMGSGLQVLHEHDIIHRDLKPSNIMIVPRSGRESRVVVMDFGLAKSDSTEVELFHSAPEFQGGAPYFMAPELLKRARPSVASDVYSFALLVDEMVTDSRAFASKSLQGLYFEKLWEKPSPPSARSRDLPPHWETTILRCLDEEPGARYAQVSEVVHSLEAPPPTPADSPPMAISIPAAQPRSPMRRRTLLGALIGVPLFGGTATVVALAVQRVNSSIEIFDIENQTNLPGYDYLCKGTTAELTRQLLQLQGMRVFALHAPRSGAPAENVGRFSLEGLLQAHGGQIRLSIQLSDNDQKGAILWSDNFERNDIGNPLTLQSDIARNTVAAVERRVLLGTNAPRSRLGESLSSAAYRVRRWLPLQTADYLPGAPTRSNAAFDLYMRGHNLLEEVSPSTASAAIDYFKRAIDEDSQFALAYSAVADAYMALMNYNYAPHPELAQSARYYAGRAVELDRNLAEAHSVLAAVRQMDWDWRGAEASYRHALTLKPKLARARRWYAGLILQFARFDEALAEARQALELDPYDRSAPPAVGLYLFFAGRYPEALKMLRDALSDKDMLMTRHNLGQLYAWLGHTTSGAESSGYFRMAIDQARWIETAERSTSPDGRTSFADQLFALSYSLMGDKAKTSPYLDRLEADFHRGGTSPVTVGWIYAILQERDKACDLLDQAAAWRDRRLMYSKIIPFLTNLHGFARFETLLRTMSLA
jgi:serine/threonine protein kinase/tetratricopeptide (TPR) repeat protein